MRKTATFFALLAALWLLPGSAWSQQTVTIANGTDQDWYIPFYGSYTDYGEQTEFIYPATMLEDLAGSTISQLKFYTASNYANTNTWNNAVFTVKMEEVGVTTTSTTGWSISSAAQTVYTGGVAIVNNELVIEFDDEFEYVGDNLAISINVNPCGNYYSAYFLGTAMNYDAAGYAYNSSSGHSSVFAAPQTLRQFLPKVEITYQEGTGADICRTPSALAVSDIASDEATLSWTGRNSGESYVVYLNGEILSGYESDTSYTFQNLTPNTEYTVGVRAVCGVGDSSRIATVTFRTACATIAQLPWNENFNSYSWAATSSSVSASLVNLPCWDFNGLYSNNTYLYADYNHDTSSNGNSARVYGNTSTYPSFMVLPPFAEDLSNLMLTLWQRTTNISTYLGVGYMTDPADDSTYTEVAQLTPSATNTYEFYDVPFPAAATGRIAMRYYGSYNTLYFDDINVMVAPSCRRPASVTVSGIAATEATIAIYDPSQVGNYHLVLLSGTDTVVNTVISDTSLTIDTLQTNTPYAVSVYSICDDGNETAATFASFRTECVAIDSLPYRQDFELCPTGSSAMFDPCWGKGNSSNNSYPYAYSSSGNNILYFYSYGTNYSYAVMPPIDESIDITDLMLTFDQSMAYNNYSSHLLVGLVEGSTITSLADVDTIAILDVPDNQFVTQEVLFAAYQGNKRRIIIATVPNPAGSTTNYAWLDNVVLDEAPDCVRPTGLTISGLGEDEVTVSFAGSDENSYNVWIVSNGVTVDSTSISTTSHTFSDLTPATAYSVYASTVCSDTVLDAFAPVSFVTLATPATLPYSTGFEAGDDQAWLTANATNGWFIGNGTANTGTNSMYISDDQGTTYSYDASTASNSYAYKPFSVPAGQYVIQYDWKNEGDTYFHTLRAFLTPTTVQFAGNVDLDIEANGEPPAGWMAIDNGYMSGSTSWQTVSKTVTFTSDTIVNMVFYWVNDSYNSTAIPAAVDNIAFLPISCPSPANLAVGNISATGATISWSPIGSETSWQVSINGESPVTVTDTFYVASGLTASSNYSVAVTAVCGADDISLPLSGSFVTLCEDVDLPVT